MIEAVVCRCRLVLGAVMAMQVLQRDIPSPFAHWFELNSLLGFGTLHCRHVLGIFLATCALVLAVVVHRLCFDVVVQLSVLSSLVRVRRTPWWLGCSLVLKSWIRPNYGQLGVGETERTEWYRRR